MLLLMIIVGFAMPPQDGHAQGTITGTVTDATTGDPLPGATITIVGTQVGSTTDMDGRYQISNVAPGTYILRARFVGFVPLERQDVSVTSGSSATVDFGLYESAIDLGEISVVGYGTVRSEDVTGSVGVISADNISSVPVLSVDNALQGQIAGVTVQTSNGTPGGGPNIQVRGTSNVGAGGQPLYVVDGFALPQPSGEQASIRNPLTDIPTEDIESITILKDASATAIYGSRASNGVIIVTTKGGTSGPLKLNVSAYTGTNSPIDRMTINSANAEEFATFQNLLWQGRIDAGTATEIPVQYQNPSQYAGIGTNWWDQIHRTSNQYNVQVSASGGSSTLRSYFSAGYTREEGQVLETDYSRVSLRANLEANLSENITAGLRVAPVFSIRNLGYEGGTGRGGNGEPGGGAWMMCPLSPVTLEDGSFNPQIGDPSEPGGGCPGVWSQPNPVLWLQNDVDKQTSLRALSSAFVNYEVLPGLSLRQSFNVDYSSSDREQFRPSIIGQIRVAPPSVPTGSYGTASYINWLSESTVNYSGKVGPGQLDALAGFTAQQENELTSAFSGTFPDDQIQTLNVAFNLNGNTGEQSWSLLSGLARLNYNLFDKYIFTGTIRSDGSSRFGENKRWGTFPSGAFAWNLHNESFMQGYRGQIPELRARISYGETGNNQIGNYSQLGVVQASDYVFGGATAAGRVLNSLGNSDLAWEKTQEFNLGFDAALYNYQLRMSIELYQRNTTSLLLDQELPFLTGFGSVTQNTGEIRNQGVEVSLSTVNVSTPKFSWTTDFNVSFNRNEVVSLPDGTDIFYRDAGPTAFIHRVGLPMATYVGYVVDGLYESEEQIAQLTSYAGAVPGSFIIRDLNGDGQITERTLDPVGDFAVLGDNYPDFTFGVTQSFKLGNFDVRALFTGSFGGDNLRSEFFRTSRNIDGLFIVDSDYVQNVWRSPEQPGDGLTPTMNGGAFGRQQYRDNNHSLILSDASYIWLRNVVVRYNFKSGPFAGSNVYLSGDNLAIISPYDGNPDVTDRQRSNLAPGLDFGNYPIPRSFTFGVELNL